MNKENSTREFYFDGERVRKSSWSSFTGDVFLPVSVI